MKIDPKELIAGVRPAVLKKLFRRREITLPIAMRVLNIDRTAAAAVVAALEEEGWIVGDRHSWEPTDKAVRLLATKLIPPLSATAARSTLERLIAEAEAINRDPGHPIWVQAIYLFGSLLNAGPNGTVGDIDVAAELRRRPGSEALWDADVATAPSSFAGVMRYSWPIERVTRRLRRVDRWISLHPVDEALSFPHAEVFRRTDG